MGALVPNDAPLWPRFVQTSRRTAPPARRFPTLCYCRIGAAPYGRDRERQETAKMSNVNVQFVVPAGEAGPAERLQHIAIQAAAVMLQGWFEDEEPSAEEAGQMVSAVMEALLRARPSP